MKLFPDLLMALKMFGEARDVVKHLQMACCLQGTSVWEGERAAFTHLSPNAKSHVALAELPFS